MKPTDEQIRAEALKRYPKSWRKRDTFYEGAKWARSQDSTIEKVKQQPYQEWHPVEYAGRWSIQTGPMYGDNDILDAESVGYDQAKINANQICREHGAIEKVKERDAEILEWINQQAEKNHESIGALSVLVKLETFLNSEE